MILRILLSVGLCLLVSCANRERDGLEQAGDSRASSTAAGIPYEAEEAFIALVPGAPADTGMVLFWDERRACPSGKDGYASASYGSSHQLHICSFRVYNFAGQSMEFPLIEDLGLEVSMEGKTYPLRPLSAFASDFIHSGTLAMLDGAYPDSGLPGRSYTRVYLACRIPDCDPETHQPESLVLADGSRIPWIRVKQARLDAFLKKPDADRLEAMVGKSSLVLGASHGTEE